MTRTGNRNSSIVFFAALILFLIVVVAFAARAQAQAPVLFSPAATYSTGGFDNVFFDNSTWVSVKDVNGDGKLDVLVANWCSSYHASGLCPEGGNVGVSLGNGDGTFQPMVTYSSGGAGYYAFSLFVADVNADGRIDVLVANGCPEGTSVICPSGGSVGVLLGNGDGTFQAVRNYASQGLVAWMSAADVNGDGKLDVLVANRDGGSNGEGSVAVLLGRGDGTFEPAKIYSSAGLEADFVTVADVNADGHPDLLVVNFWVCNNCPGSVGVLLGNGDGTFRPAVAYGALAYVSSAAVVDVNNDGKADLVLTDGGSYGGGAVIVLLGNGDGTFRPAVAYLTGGLYNVPPEIADVNGDGKLDLVIAQACRPSFNGCIGVMLGNGDGTFRSPTTYPSGGIGTMSLVMEDVDGDGKTDVVSVSQCGLPCRNVGLISVMLGNGDGTFRTAVPHSSGGTTATWVGAADINADGRPDLLAVNTNLGKYGSLGILINKGPELITTTTTLTSSYNPSAVGVELTLTATVRSSAGPPPDGEPITFTNGSGVLGTIPLLEGTAHLKTSSFPAGVFMLTARYGGDSKFAGSRSPSLQLVVKNTNKSVTSTALISSRNPSIYGQPITWTVKVTSLSSMTPTGNVAFRWTRDTQTYTIGTAPVNASGVATLTRSNLNADPFGAPYPLVAVYSGDAFNLGSTSAVLLQDVLQTKTAATITSSLNPSKLAQPVTFTAKIISPTVMPTGPVTFSIGYTNLGTAQLSGGTAKFTTSALPVGASRVKVTYYGNSNIAKSSASILQTVQ
jgi:hypothetical protein